MAKSTNKEKNQEYDFGSTIEKWIMAAKSEEDFMNIKELSRLTDKQIKKRIHAKKSSNNGSLYKISQRHKVWDLSVYYNDPERYYYDTYLPTHSSRPNLFKVSSVGNAASQPRTL